MTRPDAGVSRETWRELLALADVLRKAERLGAAEDVPEGARWIQLSDTLATMLADVAERAGQEEADPEPVYPVRLFKAIGKEGSRVHLCSGDTRLPVSPTDVACGSRVILAKEDWTEIEISLFDFLRLPWHCINCEMILRSAAWINLRLRLADLIDRGYISLERPLKE